MYEEDMLFAAIGKIFEKFMLICPLKSPFLPFSIPKFNLKSWDPPLFLKIFPPSGFLHPNFLSGSPLLKIFKIWFSSFWKNTLQSL